MVKAACILAATVVLAFSTISIGNGQESTESATQDDITADIFRRAARNGDLELVKKGIESGIDVDAKSAYGATALFFACDRGQEDVVNYLLARGADPNVKDTFYKATPVTWSMGENRNITLSLIEHGGDFEAVLMNAVSGKDVEYAKKIVELKGDEKDSMVKARDAAMRIKDEEKREKMLAIFESLDLPEPVTVTLSKETLEALVGKYSNERIAIEMSLDEGKPMIAFNGREATEIVPTGENEFTVGGGKGAFELKGGKVEAIDLTFGETTFNLKKAEPKAEEADSEKEASAAPEPTESRFAPSSAESLAADAKISSANWPGFRGTGSRGVAEGQRPPVEFHVAASGGKEGEDTETTESNMLLWKTPVEGLGLSCPVIWNDQVFITTAATEGDAGELRTGLYGDVDSVEETQEYEFKLLCFSKTSGGLLWERTAEKTKPAVKRHAKSSHANPTVVTNGEQVVAFFGSEGIYCYSKDGDLIWKEDFGYLDSGWFYDKDYQWGFASSPTIHKNKLYVQCDIQADSESKPAGSFITCMDLKTGDEIWRTERDEIPSWSSPLVHEFGDRTMVITNSTKSSRGYDAATGELIWSMKGNSEIVVPTPNVAHGMIFVSSGYSPIRPIYAIKPSAKGDISLESDQDSNESVAWSRKSGGPYMPTPVIYGDYLYTCANNGVLTCYVAKTGEQVYKKRLRAEGGQLAFTASPLAADGHLYLTAEDGRVLVVKAGPDYEVVTTNKLNEKILATPAISEGAMFFRTQKSLIAVGQRITD
jgi:outer membrane protein assembly factor BamB